MKHSIYFLAIIALSFSISCSLLNKDEEEEELTTSLEKIDNVSLISEAENSTIVVNKDDHTYFDITFSNIKTNDVIENGSREGWCLDWQTPINSEGGTYHNIELYSTFRVEQWKSVNYLLNIKDDLLDSDSQITYREIQLAIWSLRFNPEFDLDEIAVEDLPDRMLTEEGEANFSYQKVEDILSIVESEYQDFEFSSGTKFAVIAATPSDVQTIFTVVE